MTKSNSKPSPKPIVYRSVQKSLRPLLDQYHVEVDSCTACPLCSIPQRPVYNEARPVFRGNVPCDLLFVVPSPRRIDTLSNAPLKGVEGDILDEIANAILNFYPRLRMALIPAVHCYPYFDSLEKDHRDPTKQEIKICNELHGKKLLSILQPSIIVLVGDIVKTAYPRPASLEIDTRLIRYVHIRHPTSALRSNNLAEYKRESYYAIEKVLDEEGAIFCCNKPAKFTP